MKLLLYCTKAKPYLYRPYEWDCFPFDEASRFYLGNEPLVEIDEKHNGKVVAECDFEVEEIFYKDGSLTEAELGLLGYRTNTWAEFSLLQKSCLSFTQLENYLKDKDIGYAIHIKNLHIFDEPQWLMDFFVKKRTNNVEDDDIVLNGVLYAPVRKASQNMMIVYDRDGNKYALISIRPEWLCKILNSEKTIEVRKKVLKEMI